MKLEQEGQEDKKPTMTVVENLPLDKKVKTVNNFIIRVEDTLVHYQPNNTVLRLVGK